MALEVYRRALFADFHFPDSPTVEEGTEGLKTLLVNSDLPLRGTIVSEIFRLWAYR